MPRFYFDIFDGTTVEDPEGQELGSLAIAHQKAVDYAREMAADDVRQAPWISTIGSSLGTRIMSQS